MKVMGIDPGVAIMGWSVIEAHSVGRYDVLFGVLRTPAHMPLNRRLVSLYDQLEELFETHKPAVLAVETLFFVKNAKTLAMVAHARGIALLVAGKYQAELCEYAPKQVKMALTGSGAADKRQMQQVLQKMLGHSQPPQPDDAADALAVGLCHLQYARHALRSAVTV
jgi:crossover junction endodeoxyribonuclease RuvC